MRLLRSRLRLQRGRGANDEKSSWCLPFRFRHDLEDFPLMVGESFEPGTGRSEILFPLKPDSAFTLSVFFDHLEALPLPNPEGLCSKQENVEFSSNLFQCVLHDLDILPHLNRDGRMKDRRWGRLFWKSPEADEEKEGQHFAHHGRVALSQ